MSSSSLLQVADPGGDALACALFEGGGEGAVAAEAAVKGQLLGLEGTAGGDGIAAETHEVVDAEVVDVVVIGGALAGEVLAKIVAVDTDGCREV